VESAYRFIDDADEKLNEMKGDEVSKEKF